ncbi:hypothetical protein SYNPS1DRAFT_26516 [Syncephalis pseudoplumigaleata]|uniref:B30.2/SPRY domain-containing protein n=1 Tax=Syncephalis pseudoplumigaleata TaxID=1712513 RepID=A0A4P9Z5D4_9FUNG|nr:hypothetical protein SYNPS1DRAFT_26516 [Syncephalis pseudoplumigaleata]|eukprot:RKP27844.1 hypothetical protein SYNPS1DRAFT_26516 [Syncephalis pseudoplumigaleata]
MEEDAVQDFFALADSELQQNEERIARHQEALHRVDLSPEERAMMLEEIGEMQSELVRSDPFITDLLCILSGGALYGRCVERCRQLARVDGIWSHLGRYIRCDQTYPRFRAICTLREMSNVSPQITCNMFRSSCGPELMRIAHACADHSTRHNAVVTLLLQANQLQADPAFSYDYEEFMRLVTMQTIKPMMRRIIMLIQTVYAFPIAEERARPALPMVFGLHVTEPNDASSSPSFARDIRETMHTSIYTHEDNDNDDDKASDHHDISRPITPANTPVNERELDMADHAGDAPGDSYRLLRIRETVTELVGHIRLLTMFAVHASFARVVATLSLGPAEELPVDAASLSAWIEEMELLGAGGHRPFRVLVSLLLQMQWMPAVHAGRLSAEDKTFIRTKVSHTALTGNLTGVDQLGDHIKRAITARPTTTTTTTTSMASSSPTSSPVSPASSPESPEDMASSSPSSMKIDSDEGLIDWKDACFKYSAQLLVCLAQYGMLVPCIDALTCHSPIIALPLLAPMAAFIDRRRLVSILLDIGRICTHLQPTTDIMLGQLARQLKATELFDSPELISLAHRLVSEPQANESTAATMTAAEANKPALPWAAYFYAHLIMDRIANYAHEDDADESTSQEGLLLTPNMHSAGASDMIYNPHWTFESFRSAYRVVGHGRWAFEVVVPVKGLVQVGWSTMQIDYQPESGSGVGDDGGSYSIDGHRCMRWHGAVPPVPNDYGQRWQPGDVVTCMVDFTARTLSFALNGECLGVAFSDIDPQVALHPSVSCSAHQGCRIRYGYSWDPLQYAPSDYRPVVTAHVAPALMDLPTSKHSSEEQAHAANSGKPSSLSLHDLSILFYYEIHVQERASPDRAFIIGFQNMLGHYEGLSIGRAACHYRRGSHATSTRSPVAEGRPDSENNVVLPGEPVRPGDVIGCVATLNQIGFYLQGSLWIWHGTARFLLSLFCTFIPSVFSPSSLHRTSMPSGLESLLEVLPSADRCSLLLEIGPVVCCQLQQTNKLLFELIAADNVLWHQLYKGTFDLEDEREVEALSVFRASLAATQDEPCQRRRRTHSRGGGGVAVAAAHGRTGGAGGAGGDDEASGHHARPSHNSSSNSSNNNNTDTAFHGRHTRRRSSVRPRLRRRSTTGQSLRQVAWWQRAFALRYRLNARWRQGKPQLLQLQLPAFLGHLPQPGASYGPWIVVRSLKYRLYLGDLTTMVVATDEASGGEHGAPNHTIQWHELPIDATWEDRPVDFVFSSLMNDRHVATVVSYGEQNVLYVWATSTRRRIYQAVLANKGNIDHLYGDYILMSSLSGERSATNMVDLVHGARFSLPDTIVDTYWHFQRQQARHRKDGLMVYSATEHGGIITWSLLEYTLDADGRAQWTAAESGRLELLSNQHRLYGTSRIDDHRVLVSMAFFEHPGISHIGLHDLRHGIQARIEWSHALSGRVIATMLSENILLCYGAVCMAVSLEDGAALCRLSNRHGSGLQRLLGAWVGESFPQRSQPLLVTNIHTGKVAMQLVNSSSRSSGRRYYTSLRAGYIIEMFANESTLYVWDFLATANGLG